MQQRIYNFGDFTWNEIEYEGLKVPRSLFSFVINSIRWKAHTNFYHGDKDWRVVTILTASDISDLLPDDSIKTISGREKKEKYILLQDLRNCLNIATKPIFAHYINEKDATKMPQSFLLGGETIGGYVFVITTFLIPYKD